MNEERKNEDEAGLVRPATDGKKDAEAQGMYHYYCRKCGNAWWSSTPCNYCTRFGCTGQAIRM